MQRRDELRRGLRRHLALTAALSSCGRRASATSLASLRTEYGGAQNRPHVLRVSPCTFVGATEPTNWLIGNLVCRFEGSLALGPIRPTIRSARTPPRCPGRLPDVREGSTRVREARIGVREGAPASRDAFSRSREARSVSRTPFLVRRPLRHHDGTLSYARPFTTTARPRGKSDHAHRRSEGTLLPPESDSLAAGGVAFGTMGEHVEPSGLLFGLCARRRPEDWR
jgi:hypothetical protein